MNNLPMNNQLCLGEGLTTFPVIFSDFVEHIAKLTIACHSSWTVLWSSCFRKYHNATEVFASESLDFIQHFYWYAADLQFSWNYMISKEWPRFIKYINQTLFSYFFNFDTKIFCLCKQNISGELVSVETF